MKDQGPENSTTVNQTSETDSKLSYKFQRLRERLRDAIASGELSGKLPGERILARRFHVNAKTLSKALTDLAAEGLLDRTIGRGTFVKGSRQTKQPPAERWLLLCDPDQTGSSLIQAIRDINDNLQIVTDPSTLRPSVLHPVRAVIDMSSSTPDAMLRDFVVRNLMVVLVGREPSTYSVNAVLVDRALGAGCLARDMMLEGHTRFVAVERRGQNTVSEAIRRAAVRYAPTATVDSVFPSEVAAAVEQGATAIICDMRRSATIVRETLEGTGIGVPDRVSIAAIGSGPGEFPCSGYFVQSNHKAQTIVELLRDKGAKRPTTIWLTGAYVDNGTIAAPQALAMGAARAAEKSHAVHIPATVRA